MKLINKTYKKFMKSYKNNKNKFIFIEFLNNNKIRIAITTNIFISLYLFYLMNSLRIKNMLYITLFILIDYHEIFLSNKYFETINSYKFFLSIIAFISRIINKSSYIRVLEKILYSLPYTVLVLESNKYLKYERLTNGILFNLIIYISSLILLKTNLLSTDNKNEWKNFYQLSFYVKGQSTNNEVIKGILNLILFYIVLYPSINYLGGKFILDKYIL